VFTAHTSNPVKCILFGRDHLTIRDGRLADIAPTILEIQGLEAPAEMTGESLIVG
jgi:2,3-bisphosphoglycerate-independent phosphoglycerate mutase